MLYLNLIGTDHTVAYFLNRFSSNVLLGQICGIRVCTRQSCVVLALTGNPTTRSRISSAMAKFNSKVIRARSVGHGTLRPLTLSGFWSAVPATDTHEITRKLQSGRPYRDSNRARTIGLASCDALSSRPHRGQIQVQLSKFWL